MTTNPIKKAIVSVFDKSYLNLLAEYFLNFNINVFSTGGTSKFLKSFSSKIKVIDISDFTTANYLCDATYKVPFALDQSYTAAINDILIKEKNVKLIIV